MALRCLIVDDSPAFIVAARKLLDGGELTIVGQAGTAAEALECSARLSPDVVLLDVDLGGESGFEVARRLSGQSDGPGPRILLISAYPEDDFRELVAESPAIGFLGKSEMSAPMVVDLVRSADAARGNGAQRDSR